MIHYLDVVDVLQAAGCTRLDTWAWTRQLRYYAVAHKGGTTGGVDVRVCMAEASFTYGWDYSGNTPKLVYTPLTDKCFLTITNVRAE